MVPPSAGRRCRRPSGRAAVDLCTGFAVRAGGGPAASRMAPTKMSHGTAARAGQPDSLQTNASAGCRGQRWRWCAASLFKFPAAWRAAVDDSGGGAAAGFAALPTDGGAGAMTGLVLLAGAAGFAFACWEALAKVTGPVKMTVIVETVESGGKGAPPTRSSSAWRRRPAPCTPPPRRAGGRGGLRRRSAEGSPAHPRGPARGGAAGRDRQRFDRHGAAP